MGLLLFVPGLILLATDGWFNDQHTVGAICAGIGGLLILAQLAFALVVGRQVTKRQKEFRSRW